MHVSDSWSKNWSRQAGAAQLLDGEVAAVDAAEAAVGFAFHAGQGLASGPPGSGGGWWHWRKMAVSIFFLKNEIIVE